MALTKITTSVVAVNSLTTANIADNSIDATKIASNSILTRHIDDAQITTDQILDGTIATADIADDAITEDKLANAINTSIAAKLPLVGGTLTGNVGIGVSPANKLEIQHGTVGTGNGSNNTLALRYNSTTLYGQHYMDNNGLYHIRADAQGVSGGNLILGGDASVQIWTGSTPERRVTVDSSGNLMVGTTDTFPGGGDTNTGVSLHNSGAVTASRDGDFAARFNRKTSDGEIIGLNKDGSPVGSIGTDGGSLVIGGGDVGIGFYQNADALVPINGGTRALRDSAIDLGLASGGKFKDLYLSGKAITAGADLSGQVQHFAGNVSTYFNAANSRYGQIFMDGSGFNIRGWTSSGEPILYNAAATGASHRFQVAGAEKVRITNDGLTFNGDTAAANALDDYEEGTFSPTLSNAYNITSLTLSEAGRYTKVGSLVHFEFQVSGSFTNAAVESRFSFTVPFNIATSSSRATGMFSHHLTTFSNGRFNNGQIFQGTTTDTASWVYISTNQLSGIGSFTGRGTFTYVAA